MGIFDDGQKAGDLFRDPVALDYDYQPKIVPYREALQEHIATCIKPLFKRQNGRNIVIHGTPGIGKTVAVRHVLNEINDHTEDIIPLYINCWKKNTSFKILIEICELIGYKFTQNKNTRDLFNIIKERLNKYSVVFCFDEVDKLDDFDFLYFILEDIYRSTIILVTNFKHWHAQLDERIHSRLMAELCEFSPYTRDQIKDILKQRMKYAFHDNVFDPDAFDFVIEKTVQLRDMRSGLYLLREAGNAAEDERSVNIQKKHVMIAIRKLDDFSIKDTDDLHDEEQQVLSLIKEYSGRKIGDLFIIYQDSGGDMSYKSFTRRVKNLEEAQFITVEKISGAGGNTSIIKYKEEMKRLSDF